MKQIVTTLVFFVFMYLVTAAVVANAQSWNNYNSADQQWQQMQIDSMQRQQQQMQLQQQQRDLNNQMNSINRGCVRDAGGKEYC